MTPFGIERLAQLFLIKESEYSCRYLVVLHVLKHIDHVADRPHNGYFDETMKDDVIGVGGWIGSYDDWNKLEYEWRKALPKEAKGDFHYTDFWARSKTSYGQGWSYERRIEHVRALAQIAHECTSFAVGFVFDKRSYDELIPAKDKKVLKSPLHFCLAHCLAMLLGARPAKHLLPPTPWDIMFDEKREERDSIGQIYYRTRSMFDHEDMLGNIGFGKRKNMAALQAADLLVGELRRKYDGKKSDVLQMLHEKHPILVAFPTDKDFRRYFKDVQARLGRR